MEVLIVGGGIGGLTLALSLRQANIPVRVYESVPEIKPLGVGINLLPHATREFEALGVLDRLAEEAVENTEMCFYNQHGQEILVEPRGLAAGYKWPQLSIHRGRLQMILLEIAKERLGAERIITGHHCRYADQNRDGATAYFDDPVTGDSLGAVAADVVIAADGIKSTLRRQNFPTEGPPRYSGINMWRGVTRTEKFLSGHSMVLAGSLRTGKFVIYPIVDNVDGSGQTLINWVAEIETDDYLTEDWNREGRIEDFIDSFADWHFDWLDVPDLIHNADAIYEFPMIDREPIKQWTYGRTTLLGDAAHPMLPRGSNGACQAVLDARVLTKCLLDNDSFQEALKVYEAERLPATAEIVRMNRSSGPDIFLTEIDNRTGGEEFDNINNVISPEEIKELADAYKITAGFQKDRLNKRLPLV